MDSNENSVDDSVLMHGSVSVLNNMDNFAPYFAHAVNLNTPFHINHNSRLHAMSVRLENNSPNNVGESQINGNVVIVDSSFHSEEATHAEDRAHRIFPNYTQDDRLGALAFPMPPEQKPKAEPIANPVYAEHKLWEGFVENINESTFTVGFVDDGDKFKIPRYLTDFEIEDLTSEEQNNLVVGSCIHWEIGMQLLPDGKKIRVSSIQLYNYRLTESDLVTAHEKAKELLNGIEWDDPT